MSKDKLNAGDYRSRLDEKGNPSCDSSSLWSRDVLVHYALGQGSSKFSSKTISEDFGISIKDAGMRLSRLSKWGCINQVNEGRRNRVFEVSDWGEEVSEKWKKEGYGMKRWKRCREG